MHSTFALAAFAAVAYAQGITEDIAPSAPAPEGCSMNYNGRFQISTVNITSGVMKRQNSCDAEGALALRLNNGVLLDNKGATGSIVANYQFQFDMPAQTGAIYTAGFSACSNGSLALGGSAIFYRCLSGDFYNLYDRNFAPQCSPILLEIIPCPGGSAVAPSNAVGQLPDGQPTGTAVGAPVTQIADGQIQAPTGMPVVSEAPDGQLQVPTTVVTQIGDGQIQAPTSVAAPVVTQIGDGQVQAPTGIVSQITDGQIQAPTSVVSQIPDGQIQAPTSVVAPVVTQIPDGQIQAPTSTAAPVVSQISDGQIQAPTGVVSQIPDGQIQAPTSSVAPVVTQIPDGQIQAPANGTGATPSAPAEFVGAGSKGVVASSAAGIVGLMVAFALL